MQIRIFSFLASFVGASVSPAPSSFSDKDIAEDVCERAEQMWPTIVRQTEAATRLPDRGAFRAARAPAERALASPPFSQCPRWTRIAAMHQAVINEFDEFHALNNVADSSGFSAIPQAAGQETQITNTYIRIHDAACIEASKHMDASWDTWLDDDINVPLEERKQRYLSSLKCDDYLVRPDGSLGAPLTPDAFVPLAKTPVLKELEANFGSLQGQGPMTPDAAEAYVRAALQYAKVHNIERVAFVNAAGGQLLNFSSQVEMVRRDLGVDAIYSECTGWADGHLLKPVDLAAYAEGVADELYRDKGSNQSTLLVVNCNAGLNRSSTLNVLIQLILQTRLNIAQGMCDRDAEVQGFAAIPDIVQNIKLAIPRAVSSKARNGFLYRAYEVYWQRRVAGMPATPDSNVE